MGAMASVLLFTTPVICRWTNTKHSDRQKIVKRIDVNSTRRQRTSEGGSIKVPNWRLSFLLLFIVWELDVTQIPLFSEKRMQTSCDVFLYFWKILPVDRNNIFPVKRCSDDRQWTRWRTDYQVLTLASTLTLSMVSIVLSKLMYSLERQR